ncbi:hypothetical protein Daus18300_002108 [Diaporthe australafricana]|uniref:Uncharacterized protein n=1 Tax=Diaporthe australafricana TaxID=127596 RepID=A0ABR3XQC2_9PEZI
MSDDIDIFVSNGTCYSSAHLKADSAMIPCGNDANDHAACCQAGDNCLESSVCYSPEYGVTYISGCSDPSYEHPSCPNKFNDRATPWLGLSYCNGTSNEWVICDQKKKSPVLTKPDTCFCPTDEDDRTMTLSQSSIIKGTASLPTTLGESIQFSRGYYPTVNSNSATATASTADASISSSSLSSASPDFTEATSNDNSTNGSPGHAHPPQQSGLSPGAKIGTIAGAVIGTLLLALMAMGWMCLRRRRQKQQLQREEEERAVDNFMHGDSKGGAASEPDPLNLGLAMGPASDGASSNPNTPALSELDTKAARPWSMRSELEPETTTRPFHAMTTGGQQARRAPSELAAHPIAELP